MAESQQSLLPRAGPCLHQPTRRSKQTATTTVSPMQKERMTIGFPSRTRRRRRCRRNGASATGSPRMAYQVGKLVCAGLRPDLGVAAYAGLPLVSSQLLAQPAGVTGSPGRGPTVRPGQTGQLWPPLPNPAPPPQQPRPDNPIVGGSLRAMTWNEDFDLGSGRVPERGFQPRFLGLGGSISTMVAMFPSVGTNVDSHYWCTPGVEVMGDNPARFNPHMNAFATNTLLPTHYDDFLSHIDSTYWYTY
jgi:hypothetical protein